MTCQSGFQAPGIQSVNCASSRNTMRSPDSTTPTITALNASSALRVTSAARIARRIEHDDRLGRRQPVDVRQLLVDDEVAAQRHREQHAERAAVVSQRNDVYRRQLHLERRGARVRLLAEQSNAPSSTHMNAVCAALVPAASARLFCQRL